MGVVVVRGPPASGCCPWRVSKDPHSLSVQEGTVLESMSQAGHRAGIPETRPKGDKVRGGGPEGASVKPQVPGSGPGTLLVLLLLSLGTMPWFSPCVENVSAAQRRQAAPRGPTAGPAQWAGPDVHVSISLFGLWGPHYRCMWLAHTHAHMQTPDTHLLPRCSALWQRGTPRAGAQAAPGGVTAH